MWKSVPCQPISDKISLATSVYECTSEQKELCERATETRKPKVVRMCRIAET